MEWYEGEGNWNCRPVIEPSLLNPASALFRDLTEKEALEFRQWARDNYKEQDPIKGIWHPVVQDECVRINAGIPQ